MYAFLYYRETDAVIGIQHLFGLSLKNIGWIPKLEPTYKIIDVTYEFYSYKDNAHSFIFSTVGLISWIAVFEEKSMCSDYVLEQMRMTFADYMCLMFHRNTVSSYELFNHK